MRHRAARGAKFQRADWSIITDLPTKPKACAKRVASLKRNKVFRKALMRLCNLLSERYVKHLQKMQNKSLNQSGPGVFLGSSSHENDATDLFSGLDEERWDDFNSRNVKVIFEEVLRFKKMSRLEALRADQSDPENMVGSRAIIIIYYYYYFWLMFIFDCRTTKTPLDLQLVHVRIMSLCKILDKIHILNEERGVIFIRS